MKWFHFLCGLYEVTFTDKEYTTIQETPKKVMIVKNNSIYGKTAKEIFDEYMESRGFKEEKRQKQEGILVYSNGKIKENIKFLANKYYAKIDWE